MTLLDRYILRTLLGAVAMVMAVLLVLGLVFVFISQQKQVGIGHFGMLDALSYSALTLPQFALQALPAGTLIGGLLGMGMLARSHELVIMRVSGFSKLRLGAAVLLAAAILVGLALLVGEYLAPQLGQIADQQKAFAEYANVNFSGAGGAWIRDGNTIVNVRGRSSSAEFGAMTVYQLSADDQVAAIGRAAHARAVGRRSWQLLQYRESRLSGDDSISSLHSASLRLHTAAGAGLLQLAVTDPQDLALHTLYSAIGYLRANHIEAGPYVFAFWSRVARLAGLVAALLFALPFGFGALRFTTLSARTTLGLAVGLLYFFLQRMVESGTQVFHLDPLLLAWVPTGLLALASLGLIWRVR